jgi:hypothetical protein
MGLDPPPMMLAHDLPGVLLKDAAAAAADHAIGSQLDEFLHHDSAQAGATAGDEKALALE